ncbi:group I intron-associated PD-(D/E)XK endonuclease [Halosimplex sp. TS25]|uniref:group I intron-associated PD-(D/E)XK endonuclease n=1 Tax=Halosimplex rarum TaxID=3396619 RepID=UPI0039EC6FC7
MADADPKERGEKSEAAVIYELIRRDITVLEPFGDNERYDVVVEIDGTFHRIQIKTGRLEDGRIQFETRSSGTLTRKVEKEGYSGDIDYFAVYSPDMEETFIVPVADAPETTMGLRVEEAEKQSPNINWAENYQIDGWHEQIF